MEQIARQKAACGGTAVPLDARFAGNDDLGSIGCNLVVHPSIKGFHEVLSAPRDYPETWDLWVRIIDFKGDTSWPFSDVVHVISSASRADLEGVLTSFGFDGIVDGWMHGESAAAPKQRRGFAVYSVWRD